MRLAPLLPFDTTYAQLPPRLYHVQRGDPLPDARYLRLNTKLAQQMALPDLSGAEGLALLSGQSEGLAMAYAGHQFGNFVPQLGDGRALLLGEVVTPLGRRDIHLKGSGRTPYSRGGDGKAALGPVLREYVMAEALAALGIPTSRALAAISTGESVQRERALPGAILARVASSHLRVGSFQYAAAREDTDALEALLAHALARHAPDQTGPEGLLRAVTQAQAALIADWMSVGFIHGVMNTDNFMISGETLDYGPCAMMERFHPMQVFSSIDHAGRYAYGNQPKVALWNLAQLATALLPLMPDEDAAIEEFTQIINGFSDRFSDLWLAKFCAKLGLEPDTAHRPLISDLLRIMAEQQLDFTHSFRHLATAPALADWRPAWQALNPDDALMARTNPAIIPRLHLIQAAIDAAETGDLEPLARLTKALEAPYIDRDPEDPMIQPASKDQAVTRTFCGT